MEFIPKVIFEIEHFGLISLIELFQQIDWAYETLSSVWNRYNYFYIKQDLNPPK